MKIIIHKWVKFLSNYRWLLYLCLAEVCEAAVFACPSVGRPQQGAQARALRPEIVQQLVERIILAEFVSDLEPVVQEKLMRVADLGKGDVDDWFGDESGLRVLVNGKLLLGLRDVAAVTEEGLHLLVT